MRGALVERLNQLEESGERPLRALDSVWVPAGHRHGMRVGDTPVIDLGFKAPPEAKLVEVWEK